MYNNVQQGRDPCKYCGRYDGSGKRSSPERLREEVAGPQVTVDESASEQLRTIADELYLEPWTDVRDIVLLLEDRPQCVLYGPPGTGKTYVALRLAEYLAGPDGSVNMVQFHPSYGYEDFVEGWRPTANGTFELRPGVLKEIVQQAHETPDAGHVLIIDEMNRANLSKVFGELFFLLEYREYNVKLQYSGEEFSLPDNLFIIGTMNTADRSIASVDGALRRRFHFHLLAPHVEPVRGLLRRWLLTYKPDLVWLADVVDRANVLLDEPDKSIGHSHFMKQSLDVDQVRRIWRHSIIPYLADQLRGLDADMTLFDLDRLRIE